MKIRMLRTNRGWTQEHLAQLASLSVRTVQRIEAGGPATLDSLQALAAAFDTTVEELSEGSQPPTERVFMLPRIRSGSELASLFAGAHMTQHKYDPPADRHEAELIASFLQSVQDFADIGDEIGPAGAVEWGINLTEMLEELEEGADLLVFAGMMNRRLNLGRLKPGQGVEMNVATVVLVRKDNPSILNRAGAEYIAATTPTNLTSMGAA